MADIKPFVCVRPAEDVVSAVAALPYDVYNREEAKEVVAKNPKSFLAIDRAETQFPDDVDIYDDRVYAKAAQMLKDWIADGTFIRDNRECYYIYGLTMDGRTQTGIAACASIDDYANQVIKKHENTRADKEQDRICHVDTCSAQTGPIFLAYRANAVINEVVAKTKKQDALYDFVAEDGIRHRVFVISDPEDIKTIRNAFAQIGEIYIADGHHRAASAVKVGFKRREEHPGYTGKEEFNYFLSVLFPDEELMIMDYNRVVRDLGGMTEEAFLSKMQELFDVQKIENGNDVRPLKKVTMENANEFLDMKRNGSKVVANATSMCILSPILLIVLVTMAEDSVFHVSESLATVFGCFFLLGMVAAAVFLFITYGMRESHMEHFEKECFETEYGVSGMVREKKDSYEPIFIRGTAVGVVPGKSR